MTLSLIIILPHKIKNCLDFYKTLLACNNILSYTGKGSILLITIKNTRRGFDMFQKINKFLKNEEGQALVEFALVAPIFILIFLVGTLQFGIIINYENGVLAAAREGARWGSITGDNDGNGDRKDDIRNIVYKKVGNYINMMGWNKDDIMTSKSDMTEFNEENGESGITGGDSITVLVEYPVELFVPWPEVFGEGTNSLTISHEVTIVLENI